MPSSIATAPLAVRMSMLQHLASLAFLFGSGIIGVLCANHFNFDPKLILVYFLLPYYALAIALQYVFPQQPNRFEKGEVVTDLWNNGGLLVVTQTQNFLMTALTSFAAPGLLIHFGWLAPEYALSHQPFWLQVVAAILLFDFCFYWSHRLAHEVPFLWRFHSVHHCAHRLSVLNASRVHPLDLVWRRLVPIFVVLQTGVSPEAFIVAGMLGSILATITHMNVAFRFRWLNYVIGTNENHSWHHSNKIEEAKNFGIWVIWDHLFGSFVLPKGRSRPEKMGLFDERFYPRHNFWQQLLIPLRWTAWKHQQAQADGLASTPSAPAVDQTPTAAPINNMASTVR